MVTLEKCIEKNSRSRSDPPPSWQCQDSGNICSPLPSLTNPPPSLHLANHPVINPLNRLNTFTDPYVHLIYGIHPRTPNKISCLSLSALLWMNRRGDLWVLLQRQDTGEMYEKCIGGVWSMQWQCAVSERLLRRKHGSVDIHSSRLSKQMKIWKSIFFLIKTCFWY